MKKRRLGITATEEEEQKALVDWLKLKKIPFYHIPNGMNSSKREGIRFKRLGLSPGIPDICLPVSSQTGYHALYIELKRVKKGRATQYQKNWIDKLNQLGNLAVICFGWQEATKVIENYLNLTSSG